MSLRTFVRMAALAGVLGFALVAARSDEPNFRYDEAEELAISAKGEGRVHRPYARSKLILDAVEGRAGVVLGSIRMGQSGGYDRTLVVWDEYDPARGAEASFDIWGRWRIRSDWQAPFRIAAGPRHQVEPFAEVDRMPVFEDRPGAWVAWEEGPVDWGREYRSVDRMWNNATDERGPLHSWRAVRLARVDEDGGVREVRVPMPSFKRQAAREDRRDETARLGVFYEAPRLGTGVTGSLWLACRHLHAVQLSRPENTTTHVEQGYAVDVFHLARGEWAGPWRLPERQRSSNQEIILFAHKVRAEVGRSDRRAADGHRGWIEATLPSRAGRDGELGVGDVEFGPLRVDRPEAPGRVARQRPTFETEDGAYTLCFGDLHRHTDLSLCFPFYDGSLNDAYRYARGPAGLDFVGITDHARDLDRGSVDGEPWARSVEAADAHHDPGSFVAFYAYERSQGNTDHNVISLRSDALRSHKPPLTEFWEEWSPDEVITIPHATSWRPGARFCGDVWQKRDDARRPLAEVYQAYRDVSSMEELCRAALDTGQRLGFIASSDHLATSGAYACVWVPGEAKDALRRRPIFDALRARRTYGATAKIELRVRAGERWMGEELAGSGPHSIEVHVRGTGLLESIEFRCAAGVEHRVTVEGDREASTEWSWMPSSEDDYLFVRVVQGDGHRAWSSPFFVEGVE